MISKDVVVKCLYFGCWSKDQTGHFLFETNGRAVRDYNSSNHTLPFNKPSQALDGLFKPGAQSQAKIMHVPGWSIASMADYSADSRGGSNSAFLVPLEKLELEDILKYAKESFPKQFERIENKATIKV